MKLLVFVILSVVCTASAQCSTGCPLLWTKLAGMDGSCYRIFRDETTWENAQATCQQMGSNLVSIHSHAEGSLVYQLWSERATGEDSGYWIGVYRNSNTGGFQWSDGTLVDYSNWNSGEPNSEGDAVIVRRDAAGHWDDVACGESYQFVCKMAAV